MKKLFVFAAVATTLLASCSQDDAPQGGTENGEVALAVSSASLQAMSTKGTFDAGGTLTTDGTIGISVLSTTGYAALDNVEYYYDNATSKWVARNTIVYLNNNPASLLAYAPFVTGLDPKAAPLVSQKYDETKDLCASSVASAPTNADPEADFSLNHVYARITYTINKDASYTGTGLVSNIALDNAAAIFPSATANLQNLPLPTITLGTAGVVQYDPLITTMTAGTPVTSSALMVPAPTTLFTQPTILKVTVDGVELQATLPASAPTSGGLNELTAGVNYKITVTIKGTALIVNSITVTNWTESPVSGEIFPVVP